MQSLDLIPLEKAMDKLFSASPRFRDIIEQRFGVIYTPQSEQSSYD